MSNFLVVDFSIQISHIYHFLIFFFRVCVSDDLLKSLLRRVPVTMATQAFPSLSLSLWLPLLFHFPSTPSRGHMTVLTSSRRGRHPVTQRVGSVCAFSSPPVQTRRVCPLALALSQSLAPFSPPPCCFLFLPLPLLSSSVLLFCSSLSLPVASSSATAAPTNF